MNVSYKLTGAGKPVDTYLLVFLPTVKGVM